MQGELHPPARCQHLARVRGGGKRPPLLPNDTPQPQSPSPSGTPRRAPFPPVPPQSRTHRRRGHSSPHPDTRGWGTHTPQNSPQPRLVPLPSPGPQWRPPPPPPAPLGHTPPGGGRNVRSPWRGGENKFGVGGGGSKPPDHRAAPSGSRREPRAAMREGPSARGLPAPRSRSSPPIAPHRHPPGPPRPPGQAGRSGESGPGTPP